MPKQEITKGLVGGDQYEVGQRVCIIGRGTSATVHLHGRVARFTKTLMIVGYHWKRGQNEGDGQRRYRLGNAVSWEAGASEYGGSSVHPTCQRWQLRKES